MKSTLYNFFVLWWIFVADLKKEKNLFTALLKFGVGRNLALRTSPTARNSVFQILLSHFIQRFLPYVSSSIKCRVWWTANHDFHISLNVLSFFLIILTFAVDWALRLRISNQCAGAARGQISLRLNCFVCLLCVVIVFFFFF